MRSFTVALVHAALNCCSTSAASFSRFAPSRSATGRRAAGRRGGVCPSPHGRQLPPPAPARCAAARRPATPAPGRTTVAAHRTGASTPARPHGATPEWTLPVPTRPRELRVERGRGQGQKVRGLLLIEVPQLCRHGGPSRLKLACSAAASFSRPCPASAMALANCQNALQQLPLRPWLRRLENLVPAMEAQVDHQRIEVEAFEHLHPQVRVADILDHVQRGLLGLIVPALLSPA